MKRNDAQAQQAADHKQVSSALALRVLTAAEARIVAGGLVVIRPDVRAIKLTAE